MKTVKKYLAVMMSIFVIAGVMPTTVYASPEEGDVAEEEVEVIIPEEPSDLDAGESLDEVPGLNTGEASVEAADEIEDEVPGDRRSRSSSR